MGQSGGDSCDVAAAVRAANGERERPKRWRSPFREGDRTISAEDAVRIIERLSAAGIQVWVCGGWGIDALLGRKTRPHENLASSSTSMASCAQRRAACARLRSHAILDGLFRCWGIVPLRVRRPCLATRAVCDPPGSHPRECNVTGYTCARQWDPPRVLWIRRLGDDEYCTD
jgi:hypothetical protein